MGGIRQGRLLPAGQPDRDRGREPPRPARPTELGWDLDAYARRVEAFGCRAIPIDGHDLGEIDKALTQAAGADRPIVILARTRKGRALSEVEDREGWHRRPLPAEMAERAIVELGGARHLTVRGPLPEGGSLRARPRGREDPAPKPPHECLWGKVRAHRPDGGHRPDADLRPATSGDNPGPVPGPLQRTPPPPRPSAPTAPARSPCRRPLPGADPAPARPRRPHQ